MCYQFIARAQRFNLLWYIEITPLCYNYSMIRDFVHTLDTSSIRQTLAQFKLNLPEAATGGIALLEFKVLTPDSFVWRFLINGVVYYLYAEDFVEGLDDIHHKLNRIFKNASSLELIEAKEYRKFEDADPVKTATIYKKPKNEDEMMKFAVESGYDFVFLCKSDEDSDDAYFND
jgi:hypothetical protein